MLRRNARSPPPCRLLVLHRLSAAAFDSRGEALIVGAGSDPIRVVETASWQERAPLETCGRQWVVDRAGAP